ncbi:hypothetical protein LCGC14_2723970, partial [marine sediment metagenome]
MTDYDDIEIPIFAPPDDPSGASPWTARQMLLHVLSPLFNRAVDYAAWTDPGDLIGLDDSDFSVVLNDIAVDGLNVIEAVDLICHTVGWEFREEYSLDGSRLVFFKPSEAFGSVRSESRPTILHTLCAPAPGASVLAAVAERGKMLWSMALTEDISAVVNTPWGLGAPHRFEFTAELVPAWRDGDFFVDVNDPFITDADLQDLSNPNSKIFYRHYHTRGANFRRSVARQWSLNESGAYSVVRYDRGLPFDFRTVIPAKYIRFGDKGNWAPFKRRFLP